MNMMDWANNEVKIACKKERGNKPESTWDYGCACYESALKAFESLCNDEHSGYSICVTKQILDRLIDGKPLTPIEDIDEVWDEITYKKLNEYEEYQCKRMFSLFKRVYTDGKITYSDTERVICYNIENQKVPYYNGFVAKIINEIFPIAMPYLGEEKIKVYCEEYLTDRKNGDFDTMGILYVILSDGKKVDIEKFFKESKNSWQEISKDEFNNRSIMHKEREQRETEK